MSFIGWVVIIALGCFIVYNAVGIVKAVKEKKKKNNNNVIQEDENQNE